MDWLALIQQLGFPTAWSVAVAYALWRLGSFAGHRLFAEGDGYVTRWVESAVDTQESLANSYAKLCESTEALRIMIEGDITARQQREERLMKLLRRRRVRHAPADSEHPTANPQPPR